jgi:2'-5' RNA ligase
MDRSSRLFFVALLPPQDLQERVTGIKQHFADSYNSRAALKSPPHITLQPPFEWPADRLPALQECLSVFAQTRAPVPVLLSGFAAFPPRVIYINVLKTPALLTLQADLMAHLETELRIIDPKSKERPYSPHMTVGFKDLSKQNFKAAWTEFKDRPLEYNFMAGELVLLIHNGSRWDISSEFPFPPASQAEAGNPPL